MHKIVRGWKLTSAFKYFLTCYIILLICAALPFTVLFLIVNHANLNNAITISELELNACGIGIDSMIQAAAENSIQIARNSKLKKVAGLTDTFNGEAAYDCCSAMLEFSKQKNVSSYFDGGYLYYPYNDVAILDDGVFRDKNIFCNLILNGLDAERFVSTVVNGQAKNKLVQMDDKLYIINEVIFTYPKVKSAYLCYYITRARVNEKMQSGYDNYAYAILDANGYPVFSSLDESTLAELSMRLSDTNENTFISTLSGKDVLISVKASSASEALFISIIPVQSVQEKTTYISRLLFAFYGLITLVSITAGVLLSQKNSNLVRGFVREINPVDENGVDDEFQALQTGIYALRNENMHYQALIARQRTSLTATFFMKLNLGLFENDNKLIEAMNEAGIAITGKFYTAALLRIVNGDASAKIAINALFDEHIYINPINDTLYALLLITDDEHSVCDLAARVTTQLSLNAELFIGTTCDKLSEVHKSYDQANKKYHIAQKDTESEKSKEPEELEIRIKQYIMASYQNESLSLTCIAEALDMNETYLSSYFKKCTGGNISSYIEQLRVNKAYSLLTETALPIKDIAEKSGYNNDQTFRRAFKKLMGCTPGQIRQQTDDEKE